MWLYTLALMSLDPSKLIEIDKKNLTIMILKIMNLLLIHILSALSIKKKLQFGKSLKN
jgi:hypothetical protein